MAPLTPVEAKYIFDHYLGCRYGTTTQGAAYAFMDIVGEGQDGQDPPPSTRAVLDWLRNPASGEFEPRWNNRLWNTCGVIVGLSEAGTVAIVSRASPQAERYRFNSDFARGDGYSFRKCNRLPPDSRVIATITYGSDLSLAAPEQPDIPPSSQGVEVSEQTVEELYDKIRFEIRRSAG